MNTELTTCYLEMLSNIIVYKTSKDLFGVYVHVSNFGTLTLRLVYSKPAIFSMRITMTALKDHPNVYSSIEIVLMLETRIMILLWLRILKRKDTVFPFCAIS